MVSLYFPERCDDLEVRHPIMSAPQADILALTDFSRQRALWLRAANTLLRPFRALVPLDEQGLLEAARRHTGLHDFGSDDFRGPLRSFLESLEVEAQLSFVGRVLARRDIFVLLCNRLRIAETFRQNPEIEDEEIRQPLFIVGLARSGTSILHELLAQDPRHRSLLGWEARYPCPPLEDANDRSDPRIRRAQFDLSLWSRLVPVYQAMHEKGALIPTECGDITCHSFRGDRPAALYQVPGYASFIAELDIRPAYEIHKRILQILQSKQKRERWLLKNPAHMNWLDTLISVYPDARIVQTHRDPLQSMGSTVSLVSAIRWMRTEKIDPELVKLAFGPAYYETQLYKVMAQRDRGELPAAQLFDVRFQDMMSDPFDTIGGLYDYFGWDFTAEAEARMQKYLAAKPRGKFGKHVYSFHDLGLDLETERARYVAYQERYGVESEVF